MNPMQACTRDCIVNIIIESLFRLPMQLFETVKGMPLFMLNNGLLKVICQLISIVTDHAHLSVEEKELLLTDALQLCKLVVIFAIRFVCQLCRNGMYTYMYVCITYVAVDT